MWRFYIECYNVYFTQLNSASFETEHNIEQVASIPKPIAPSFLYQKGKINTGTFLYSGRPLKCIADTIWTGWAWLRFFSIKGQRVMQAAS